MKKLVLFALLILTCVMTFPMMRVFAEEKTEQEQLQDQVDKDMGDIDFSDLDEMLDDDRLEVIEQDNFKDLVTDLINGKQSGNISSIFGKIVGSVFKELKSVIPVIFIVIAVAIMCNMVASFKPAGNNKAISDIVNFVCVAVVLVLLIAVIKNMCVMTTNCISSMVNQITAIFPILLTCLTAMGSVVTVGVYQPIVALLTGGVAMIFQRILYPIFILAFIFVILNSISKQVKLNKFVSFMSSSFKWIVGFVFTLFAGFLTVQGISAGRYDTISLKATRFAMKSYIPIIGGYLSDGLDYVMLSSGLIKNAVGVAGILLLIGTILVPIITLLVFKLCLQLIAGVIEPMGDTKISNLCEDLSKVMVYPIVIILAIAFMYFLSIGLVMCTFTGV